MLRIFLSVLFLGIGAIAICTANHANIEHEQILRPDLKDSYSLLRRSCVWKKTPKQPWDQCRGDRMECSVPFSIPQGRGYLSVIRYGPYSSTGGFIETLCTATGHAPPKGSWLVLGTVGAIDPYTEEFLEFPPIHVHHIVPKTQAYSPQIPPNIAKEYPWLDFWHQSDTTFLFPASAADNQCAAALGGTKCFIHSYPTGYGKRAYRDDKSPQYIFHVQDARQADSPKLSYVLEFAMGFITELHPKTAPLKPVFDLTMGVYGKKVPYTYPLKYNTPMYNFVTYYFPMKAQLVGNRMHWHPVKGDEAWIIRGTQSDLGIAKSLHRPLALGSYETPEGAAIEVKGGLEQLKQQMKQNLLAAEKQFMLRHGGSKDSSLMRVGLENPLMTSKDGFEYLHFQNSSSVSPHAPKLLCIYYGESELITSQMLQVKARQSAAQLKRPYRGGAKAAPATAEVKGDRKPALELVNYEEHVKAKYEGALPGHYYRASSNTKMKNNQRYPHCNDFEVEPGELLTLIHFIEPRVKPDSAKEFDSTPLTLEMHSTFVTHVHVPHLPYL